MVVPAAHRAPSAAPAPTIRLFTETVAVADEAGGFRDVDTAAIEIAGGDREARYLLESFGAIELGCLDHVAVAPGSRADYLVQLDDDVHGLCAFAAYVLPQLRKLGWTVAIDPAYRWQVIETTTPWYAGVADDDTPDWFDLELGIELDGRRVNMLPALLDLLDGTPSLMALERSARRCIAVPIDDKRYLPLPPDRLRTVLAVLRELYDRDGSAATRACALVRLDGAFDGALAWEGSVEHVERGRCLESKPAVADEAPPPVRATLRPYQLDGVRWLHGLRAAGAGGILADDMGLGKTLQTIAHLAAHKTPGKPSLVVAPTSLVGNWRRELRKFAPHLTVVVVHGPRRAAAYDDLRFCDVAITTYPILVRDRDRFEGFELGTVVLDEAQTIKNARSQAHRAVCALRAEHRLSLSGTPVENDLGELWSQFAFLQPGMLGDAARFRDRYRTPIESGNDERLAELRDRVAPFILRRTKEEVARDLPPKTEIVRPVEIAGAQRELYESIRLAAHSRVRRTIAQKGIAGSTIAILDALMKLRQVCCDPRLVAVEAARAVRESAKFRTLMELLPHQLAQGRRALVFSQFTSMLGLIADGLRERGIRFVTLTGSTADRQQPIDQFEHGLADVFLISLKAGGTGLNLVSADTVIHYDPWWNPAAQAQATDRAYRIGQTKPVFVYNLIVAGSVEERMLQLQDRKRRLADSILAPGGGAALSAAEVDDLLAPLA